jgi:hypothetical protein
VAVYQGNELPPEYITTYSTEEVTPDLAMEWIAASWGKNGRNFVPTQIDKIRKYAELMRAGEWVFEPERDAIVFKNGVVCDGRHRLHAVLLSGCTIKCVIKRKVSLDQLGLIPLR